MSPHLPSPAVFDYIDTMSDMTSELSEVPFSDDYMDVEDSRQADMSYDSSSPLDLDSSEDYDGGGSSSRSHPRDRGPSYSPLSDDDMEESEEEKGVDIPAGHVRDSKTTGTLRSPLSPLEFLPTELLQDIATRINTDADLSSLTQTSPTLHSILHPERQNCIWRQRFLARYDYPRLQSTLEFPFAYKVRQFVLQGFDATALEVGLIARSGHQLDVVKEMILETYNKARSHDPFPRHSKNLAILSAPDAPNWVNQLMSCSSYSSERRKYGQPNLLFDTLQVTLSHLVLSPKSPVLAKIPSSRDNYDLARVYNYNKPFATILEVVETEPEEPRRPFRSSRFPNLRSRSSTPPPQEPQYRLDMHTLLHIRNFWQRHFTEDLKGVGENTYSSMVRSLSASGIIPREWDQPLQEWTPFETSWYGHYSCTHPWPKNRQDLEERQSCAEDWQAVDPMTLELESSTTNDKEMYWPALFASVPAFADMMPDAAFAENYNFTYIRGIAPFLDLRSRGTFSGDFKSELPKWHPYLASRVNGFVHNVPNETLKDEDAQDRRNDAYDDDTDQPIPGWKHIVMVIWKPTTRSLLAVLDHAEEEYGGASGTQISADFDTANIWNDADSDTIVVAASAASTGTNQGNTTSFTNSNSTAVDPNASTTAPATQPTEAQIEAQLKTLLTRRINSLTEEYTTLITSEAKTKTNTPPPPIYPSPDTSNAHPLPPLFSPTHIRNLEESFSQAQYLSWDDGTIDYAYAYEGIIIPGGRIMMGRWWRIHGIEGLGPGREVGPDSVGVEVKPVLSASASVSSSTGGSGDGGGDGGGDGDDDSDSGKKKKKEKGRASARAKKAADRKKKNDKKRRAKRRAGKRKASALDSDEEEFVDSEDAVEYEFVTVVNGEESRAVNGCKGLERGPFVFWTA